MKNYKFKVEWWDANGGGGTWEIQESETPAVQYKDKVVKLLNDFCCSVCVTDPEGNILED